MIRERVVLEFRTPQQPSLGTNNWGGASPLLARDVPKESLDQRYTRLNSIRTRDEIFPDADARFDELEKAYYASQYEVPPTPSRDRRGLLLKLLFPRKNKTSVLGGSKRKRWFRFPRWDHRTKWPNGWC
ncbi:hypothetical protein Tsubulata_002827 [Turnera subulata]|uniref:Uncharacterized protein n=1 Tax=Turnera subulata TaxID=218843 RepID=A0A9Q0IZ77_9ROSI|nr:hypothetical protein Tsubulata_002827 [Turnera subulata]